ncbi:MAG: MFS transporter, partial [Deltaproteobacteria bacterium]|nr:MFS transporter [Deltaproteobacteria bacterium]
MKIHYAWVVAFTGALVVLLCHGFGRMSYSVILPSMKDGLSLSYAQIGLIGTGNFIGYLGLALLGGFLASRFGSRRIIFVSLLIMGVTLFLTGLSPSFGFAFVMRFITGLGNGGSYIPTMALPAAWFVARKRGLATGIATFGTGIGLSLSGLIIPFIIAGYGSNGWRFAWYAMGIVVFACAFLVYALQRDDPSQKGLTMYGVDDTEATLPHKPDEVNPKSGIEEVTVGKGTDKVHLISAWREIVRERETWKLGAVYFNYGFAYIIYLTFFVAYLTQELGFSPKSAGLAFSALGFFTIWSGVIWGAISDMLGRKSGFVLSYLTIGISAFLLVFAEKAFGVYLSAIIFGLTISAVPVIMAASAGDSFGGRMASAAL